MQVFARGGLGRALHPKLWYKVMVWRCDWLLGFASFFGAFWSGRTGCCVYIIKFIDKDRYKEHVNTFCEAFVVEFYLKLKLILHIKIYLTYICLEIDNVVIKSDIFRGFFICKNILKKSSCYHDNNFRYFMFGKYNGFVSKARISACMYFLVSGINWSQWSVTVYRCKGLDVQKLNYACSVLDFLLDYIGILARFCIVYIAHAQGFCMHVFSGNKEQSI